VLLDSRRFSCQFYEPAEEALALEPSGGFFLRFNRDAAVEKFFPMDVPPKINPPAPQSGCLLLPLLLWLVDTWW
jgi:hypothetical protein